ncbi:MULTISPECIES: YveK family protein [Catenuloplanes]|uniref:Capsular polysaccharide biosynthesis protein n=1 Tax=Catenuloplanes niger TaxID=587534 RepID=A0AAE3ZVI3_9ACTN|nr:hypothetical protein [Catenuloplanes niger]MDR7324705.1 capsular polysaccharide biosynthesis protein [Catenuloplanes niger]
MDFADVAKLLWRRWYLTAPLLLLTVIAMVWMALVVKPDYKAIGNVTLIPPTVSTQAAIGTTQEVNPWEPSALAEATLIRLQSKALADSLAAQGFQGEWTVTTLDTNAPIISIEVVSPTERQARDALSALITVVREEVATKQEAYRLQDGEKITTLPLENSDSVEKVTTKLKRALVVVFGVGLILTIGVAVSVDAVLRRRARRQVEGAAAIPAPVPVLIPPRPVAPVAPVTPVMPASAADISSTQRIAPVVVAGPATPIVKVTSAAPGKKGSGAVYGQRRPAEAGPTPTAPATPGRGDGTMPVRNGATAPGSSTPGGTAPGGTARTGTTPSSGTPSSGTPSSGTPNNGASSNGTPSSGVSNNGASATATPAAGATPAYSPPMRKPALPAMPAVQINLTKKTTEKPAGTAGGTAAGNPTAGNPAAGSASGGTTGTTGTTGSTGGTAAPDAKPAHEATRPADKPRPMPEDATIVLPLSNAAWSRPAAEPTEATKP